MNAAYIVLLAGLLASCHDNVAQSPVANEAAAPVAVPDEVPASAASEQVNVAGGTAPQQPAQPVSACLLQDGEQLPASTPAQRSMRSARSTATST